MLWIVAIDLCRVVDAITSLLSLGYAGTALAVPVAVAAARSFAASETREP